MTAVLLEVVAALDAELRTTDIADYPGAMNGLQVANAGGVRRVAVAVDASRSAIDAAVREGANLLIVHHGLFWSGAQPVTGMAYEKLRTLLQHDVAVYASHLPLDLHPVHGNNVGLAQAFGLTPGGGFAPFKGVHIGVMGECDESTADIVDRVRAFVGPYSGTVRTSVELAGRHSRRWAICSGGGASSETLREARERGIDTLIVGEGAHHTTVEAAEHGLCVVYAGHYATETLGVQSIGAWVSERFGVPYTFLLLPTGS